MGAVLPGSRRAHAGGESNGDTARIYCGGNPTGPRMSDKSSRITRGALARSLSVSLAGLRAGSALAVDGALQRLRGSEEESNFARREARLNAKS